MDPATTDDVVAVGQIIVDSVTVLIVLGCVLLAVVVFNAIANLR